MFTITYGDSTGGHAAHTVDTLHKALNIVKAVTNSAPLVVDVLAIPSDRLVCIGSASGQSSGVGNWSVALTAVLIGPLTCADTLPTEW